MTEWAERGDTPWQEVEVDWYGGRRKAMLVFCRTGLWHRRGQDPVAIRDVLARDPAGEQLDAASFCTAARVRPEELRQ